MCGSMLKRGGSTAAISSVAALRRSQPPPPSSRQSALPSSIPPSQPNWREKDTCNIHQCTCHPAYDNYGRYHPAHKGMLFCIQTGPDDAHLGRFAFLDPAGEWQHSEFPLTASQIRRRNASSNQPSRTQPRLLRHEVGFEDVSTDTSPRPAASLPPQFRPTSVGKRPELPRPPHICTYGPVDLTMHKMHLAHVQDVDERR